jgi:AraC family transcriptional regulator
VDAVSMTQINVHMREVVGRAVALLEAADRELGQTQEAARSSIAQATSILLTEIGHPVHTSPAVVGATALLPWQSRRILDYIEAHLGTTIRVSDLCALLNRTKAHFSRAFKKTFGVSPHAYLLRRRIELASRLMLESSVPLCEIALKCGFNDQAHLSKRFKQHTGATPAAWRREQPLQTQLS